jgi:hypothetical protein
MTTQTRVYTLNLHGTVYEIELPVELASMSSDQVFDELCQRALDEHIEADLPLPFPADEDEAMAAFMRFSRV